MSPKVSEFNEFQNQRIQAAMSRRDRRLEAIVLPPDFTGQVFLRCQEEGEKIRKRIDFLNGELAHIAERIKALEAQARAMMPCVIHEQLKGDVLRSFEIVRVTAPNQKIVTPAVLKFRQTKIDPLRREQNALEQEIFFRQQELGQLKRIAKACGTGDVGLLTLLTAAWRSRLEIGGAVLGKLPEPVRQLGSRNVIYVDAAGYPLPGEALDVAGKPDLPPRSVPK
jgi:hypothetical protein